MLPETSYQRTHTHDHDFFERIPPIKSIKEITNLTLYYDAPADWYIAVTDVVNSTKAIEDGKYKDVNAIAAAAITALINQVPGIDLPFVFGGDGATILLPAEVIPEAWKSLLATQQLARDAFGLELRAGLIPVQDVLNAGYAIKVSRLRMSENFSQAIFTGGGTGYAEKLLKDPQVNARYLIAGTGSYQADFTGFECRWNKIRSPHGETVSLIVQANTHDVNRSTQIYREVLEEIDLIYGDTTTRHPITARNMRLTLNPLKMWTEARIKFRDTSPRQLLKMTYGSLLASIAMRFKIGRWGSYPGIFINATDTEKFDDTLRMIIAGTSQQRQKLRAYLEGKRLRGELVYGIHTAQDALVTCIVYDYFGRQVHFVDASDGGYALAAKEMKAQIRALSPAA
jgi:hypothetical protein